MAWNKSTSHNIKEVGGLEKILYRPYLNFQVKNKNVQL